MRAKDPSSAPDANPERSDDDPLFFVLGEQGIHFVQKLLLFVLASVGIVVLIYSLEGRFETGRLVFYGGIMLVALATMLLQRVGMALRALQLLLWGLWVAIALRISLVAGLRTPITIAYPVLLIIAGWLFSRTAAYAMAAATVVLAVLLTVFAQAGWQQTAAEKPDLDYFFSVVVASLAGVILTVHAARNMRKKYEDVRALSRENERRLEAQRAADARFTQAFRSNPLPASIATQAEGRLLAINPAWERAFGWAEAEVLGRTTLELGHWDGGHDARVSFLAQLDEHGRLTGYECRLKSRNGEARSYLASTEIMESGGQACVFSVLIDVTERLQAEQAVRRLNEELEARVEARTAALQTANRELEENIGLLQATQEQLMHADKLASLGSLVAGISHELNTPIGNALTLASTLTDRIREFNADVAAKKLSRSGLAAFSDELRDTGELLQHSLRRSADLIASFKQVAVDQTSERRRSFDLRQVIEDVLDTLRPTIRRSEHQIEDAVPEGIVMDSYPGPLGQVLINLIQNALLHAFADPDGGVIRLEASTAEDQTVTLTVSDNGNGIAPDALGRIFDPFFTTRLGQGGSGLGLSIVHRIVTRLLCGTIRVDSTPAAGTCFTIRIPRVAPEKL
ncbi:hypothetical protein GCM10025771_33770 [Niveibacterium umoris]|uniref:histidine kinase n=1 Tax=Niveibacterium umoris TaxID=1193620 RepID=A0A840BEI1_9RHOO|nr:ATP-binding protein [Niveibacterium umoris]MBB4011430.1 PAS domain S-box-containing protein [Niveibacterium umoris]